MTEYKLVCRGLPFEATEKDVTQYFQVNEDQISLPKFPDSGRCKGVAFITVYSEEEQDRIKELNSQTFTVEENTRTLSIVEYEERAPRQKGNRGPRGGGRRNRGRRNNEERGSSKPEYKEDDESCREIYVSNIPYSAEEADFLRVFKECGEIEEVTIPTLYTSGRPKGFAFVRFTTTEAREAALELNGVVMVDRELGVRANKGRAVPQNRSPPNRVERSNELSERPEGCTTVFVGNLPWETDEEGLREHFAGCGEIASTRIVRQSWTKKSRGFGYVVFADESSVDRAIALELEIGGRQIRIDYAENLNN